MRLTIVCLVILAASVAASDSSFFGRLHQRRIDRLQRLIDSLNNRDKSLLGQARDENRARIQRFRDFISSLRKGEDVSDGDEKTTRRRRDVDHLGENSERDSDYTARKITNVRRLIAKLESKIPSKHELIPGHMVDVFRVRRLKERLVRLLRRHLSTTVTGDDRVKRQADGETTSDALTEVDRQIRSIRQMIADLEHRVSSEESNHGVTKRIRQLKSRLVNLRRRRDALLRQASEDRVKRQSDKANETITKATVSNPIIRRIARLHYLIGIIETNGSHLSGMAKVENRAKIQRLRDIITDLRMELDGYPN